jgi:hypothetical protein
MRGQLKKESPRFDSDLLALLADRQGNVVEDILDSRLEIEQHKLKPYDYEEELKQRKVSLLREQSTEIQRKLLDMHEGINEINPHGESRTRIFEINEEKVKEYEEFVRRQKKEKEERLKMLEEQKKKEEETRIKK